MKLGHCIVLFIGFGVCFSKAAVDESLAAEILSLPIENRKLALKRPGLYESFFRLALNPKSAMRDRWKSVAALAEVAPQRAQRDYVTLIKSPEWFIRNAALLGLESVDPNQARTQALEMIRDPALVVRSAAVEVMGKSLSSQSRQVFWRELRKSYNFRGQESLWVRGQMLKFLSQDPQIGEEKKFAELLEDKDGQVQHQAVRALEVLHQKTFRDPTELKTQNMSHQIKEWKKYLQASGGRSTRSEY